MTPRTILNLAAENPEPKPADDDVQQEEYSEVQFPGENTPAPKPGTGSRPGKAGKSLSLFFLYTVCVMCL